MRPPRPHPPNGDLRSTRCCATGQRDRRDIRSDNAVGDAAALASPLPVRSIGLRSPAGREGSAARPRRRAPRPASGFKVVRRVRPTSPRDAPGARPSIETTRRRRVRRRVCATSSARTARRHGRRGGHATVNELVHQPRLTYSGVTRPQPRRNGKDQRRLHRGVRSPCHGQKRPGLSVWSAHSTADTEVGVL